MRDREHLSFISSPFCFRWPDGRRRNVGLADWSQRHGDLGPDWEGRNLYYHYLDIMEFRSELSKSVHYYCLKYSEILDSNSGTLEMRRHYIEHLFWHLVYFIFEQLSKSVHYYCLKYSEILDSNSGTLEMKRHYIEHLFWHLVYFIFEQLTTIISYGRYIIDKLILSSAIWFLY